MARTVRGEQTLAAVLLTFVAAAGSLAAMLLAGGGLAVALVAYSLGGALMLLAPLAWLALAEAVPGRVRAGTVRRRTAPAM